MAALTQLFVYLLTAGMLVLGPLYATRLVLADTPVTKAAKISKAEPVRPAEAVPAPVTLHSIKKPVWIAPTKEYSQAELARPQPKMAVKDVPPRKESAPKRRMVKGKRPPSDTITLSFAQEMPVLGAPLMRD